MTNIGANFGLGGLLIERAVRTGEDTEHERTLLPVVGNYDPSKSVLDVLNAQLRTNPMFQSATTAPSADRAVLRQQAFDALLEVTLEEWGLRACRSPEASKDVQVSFKIAGRLLLLDTDSLIWERTELYLDGNCYSVDTFRQQDGLLMEAFVRASDGLARRIVNEILFP